MNSQVSTLSAKTAIAKRPTLVAKHGRKGFVRMTPCAMSKQLYFHDDGGLQKMKAGVDKLASVVGMPIACFDD